MRKQIVWLSVLVVMVAFGCGHRAGEKPSSASPQQTTAVPLPEWAPKDPSPEFLRAARVLKPLPTESVVTGDESGAAIVALSERLRATWPSAYEFFGSLNDEQIERLLTTRREVRLPVKSLTSGQREALNRWFDAYRTAMKGATQGLPMPDDYLVQLYKSGAAEDLTNVDVGFATTPVGPSSSSVATTHRVHLWFWVRKQGGAVEQFGYGIAQL